jgi:hypothetical protein
MRNDPTEVGQSGSPKAAAHEHHLSSASRRGSRPSQMMGMNCPAEFLEECTTAVPSARTSPIAGLLLRRPAQSFFAALPDSWLARWRNMCEYMM